MKNIKLYALLGAVALSLGAFLITKANKLFTGVSGARVTFSVPFTISGLPPNHFTTAVLPGHTVSLNTASGGIVGILITSVNRNFKIYLH